MDKISQKILEDVKAHGLHIIGVMADSEGPPFSYSIGFYANHKHPEIIIFGMNHGTAHTVISCCIGDIINEGHHFADGELSSELLEGYNCAFRTVLPKFYDEYLGQAEWFYKSKDFPVLQCFWPDERGYFPWQSEADDECRELQPLLYLP